MRESLRKNVKEHQARRRKAQEKGDAFEDYALDRVDLAGITDVHNADGKSTPIYRHFKYEDWVILSFRVELHLLVASFLHDIAAPDHMGIPSGHVEQLFTLYFKTNLDLGKLGAETLAKGLEILQAPMELLDGKELRSELPMETALEEFVKGTEEYRRARIRRVEAGDESAKLSFPRLQKARAPAKAPDKVVVHALAKDAAAPKPQRKLVAQLSNASTASSSMDVLGSDVVTKSSDDGAIGISVM